MKQQETYSRANDGIDHINVYSKAKTPAGRLLSNFAHTPFTIYGVRFASVEGFYQSMLFDDDGLRAIIAGTFGKKAKDWGKKSCKQIGDPVRTWDGKIVEYEGAGFYEEFVKAVRAKILQNPSVLSALLSTADLPLTHYYFMFRKIIPKGETGFFASYLTLLRREFRDRMAVPESSPAEDLSITADVQELIKFHLEAKEEDSSHSKDTRKAVSNRARKRAVVVGPTENGDDCETPARSYRMQESYEVGEVLDHPNFGIGRVIGSRELNKIEVRFSDNVRVLLHNRCG